MNCPEIRDMRHKPSQIRVWQIDGSTKHFCHSEQGALNQMIAELHSGHLFNQDRIIFADEDLQMSFFPPRVTRVDLITDRATVWDFPFAFGALYELAEDEFADGLRAFCESPDSRSGSRIFFEIEMVGEKRTCLEMEIVSGFPAARLAKIFSLFNGRQLIFGLLAGGVGVLNLSNVARFAIHPEPVPIKAVNSVENRHEVSDVRGREENGRVVSTASLKRDSARIESRQE